MSDREELEALRRMAELEAKAAGDINDPVLAEAPTEEKAYFDARNPIEKARIGMGKGMMDIVTGVKQLGAKVGNAAGLVDDVTLANMIQQDKADAELYKSYARDSTAAKIGEFAGQAIPTAIIPGGVAGNMGRRAVTAALAGAGIGAVQPTQETSIGANVTNAAVGGVLGAGTAAALAGAGKAFNALTGKVPQNEIADLSKQFNIPVTLGETTGRAGTQRTEVILERIPFLGLQGFRKKQHEAADNAAKAFLAKYIADPTAPDAMAANREFSSGLYKNMKSIVSQVKDKEIIPSSTKNTAKDLLDTYPDIFKLFQDTKTEELLKNIVSGTKNVVKDEGVNITGLPIQNIKTVSAKTLTFDEAWALRDGLGDMIGQARKQIRSGQLNERAYGQLKHLFASVNDDIDGWASKEGRPEIRTAINAANDAYKNYVVKYDVIQRAYDKAAGTVGAKEMFSPKTFSTALKKIAYDDKALKKFKPDEIAEISGLANIMQVVKRSGQYMENPPTGNRWGALLGAGGLGGTAFAAGGAAAAIKTGGAAMATAGIARFLTTTATGKNLMQAASKVEPNNPAMGKIVNQIYNQMPKWATISQAQNNQDAEAVSVAPPSYATPTNIKNADIYTQAIAKVLQVGDINKAKLLAKEAAKRGLDTSKIDQMIKEIKNNQGG